MLEITEFFSSLVLLIIIVSMLLNFYKTGCLEKRLVRTLFKNFQKKKITAYKPYL